ncbi:hypothetical protein ACFL1Y_01835, partial [Patescibacteria group bacterium]
KRSGYGSEDNYTVYRCQGDATYCSSSSNYAVMNDSAPDFEQFCSQGSQGNCTFDDTSVAQNTRYYYYIHTIDDGLNNFTDSPSCESGYGVIICPLYTTTHPCPPQGLSASHTCGTITLDWTSGDAETYNVERCSGLGCTPSEEIASGLYDSTYDDNEVIPVNVVDPPDANYYLYHIIGVNEEGEPSPPSDIVDDYSYCYRGQDWTER